MTRRSFIPQSTCSLLELNNLLNPENLNIDKLFLLSVHSFSIEGTRIASIQFLWGRNNPNVKFLRQESHGEDRQEEAEAQKQGQHQNHHKTGLRSCTLDDAKHLNLKFVQQVLR